MKSIIYPGPNGVYSSYSAMVKLQKSIIIIHHRRRKQENYVILREAIKALDKILSPLMIKTNPSKLRIEGSFLILINSILKSN